MIGVIICVPGDVTTAVAIEMRRQLTLRFPGVEFAVVPATHALAFEYDETAILDVVQEMRERGETP